MRTSLTPSQYWQLFQTYHRYNQRGWEPIGSRAEIQAFVNYCYTIIHKSPPLVLIVQSPIQAQILIKSLKSKIQLRDQLRDQLRGQLDGQLDGQLGLGNQLRDQLGNQLRGQLDEYVCPDYYGDISDYGWIAFYDYCYHVLPCQIPAELNHRFIQYRDLLLSANIFMWWSFVGMAIVSEGFQSFMLENHEHLRGIAKFADGWCCRYIPREDDCSVLDQIWYEPNFATGYPLNPPTVKTATNFELLL